MRPHFQLAISSFLPATLSDSATVNSHRMRGIHCEDEPAKVRIQNHYERTNQTIENKGKQFFEPTKLLKTSLLLFLANQMVEGIKVSNTTEPQENARLNEKVQKSTTEQTSKGVKIQKRCERTQYRVENKCDGIWSPSIFMKKNEVPLFTQYIHEGKWVKADSRRKFVGDPTDFPTDLHEKASPNPAWRLLAVSGREIGMGM